MQASCRAQPEMLTVPASHFIYMLTVRVVGALKEHNINSKLGI